MSDPDAGAEQPPVEKKVPGAKRLPGAAKKVPGAAKKVPGTVTKAPAEAKKAAGARKAAAKKAPGAKKLPGAEKAAGAAKKGPGIKKMPAAKKAAGVKKAAAAGPETPGRETEALTEPTAASRRQADTRTHDVLVIGGGPSGSACAYWLAEAGWDVAVVEKKHFPREKTCGDGLTPRAVRQLADMGLEPALAGSHRYVGLRSVAWGHTLELTWPSHPDFPSYGYTITRHDLDGLVAGRAAEAGATVHQGTEAVEPILDRSGSAPQMAGSAGNGHRRLPACLGAVVRDAESGDVREVRARYVVVADGSNSRFGRSLGTARQKSFPLGMALRGYYRSPRHDDRYIESHLDIRDLDGSVVPGYGWIFPLGDGRVNVGVGLLSTEQRWKGVNTSKLMEAFVAQAPRSWGLSPESCCGPATGGKLPMSLAVDPHFGPNTLLVGDAAGSINPFNGEGIAYAYETGRAAARFLAHALSGEGPAALDRYERYLAESYGDYYRVGRAFVKLVSDPRAMQWCVSLGMRSEPFMAGLMRIMANLMRPDPPGPAEVGYDLLLRLADVISRYRP